jgi:membrane associated rhomboid family serine protease
MIVPCPVNFWEVSKYPLTWGLIFINFFIYVVFFLGAADSSKWNSFFDDENLNLTGRIYHQYLQAAEPRVVEKLPEWIQTMKPTTAYHYQSLAAWALRDSSFLNQAENLSLDGDIVAIKSWQDEIHRFKNSYFDQAVFKLGLSQVNRNSLSWVTYQFSHSSLVHLLSNMIYLLIIGTAVEAMVGAGALIFLYLIGGVFAGFMFLFIKSHGGAIPMIGASGSVSALMAFYVLFEQRKNIRYIFLVSFHHKHHGNIYLPALWIIPLFMISDFSNHFSSIEGLGAGVAYSAHIGGTLFGAALALICRYMIPIKNTLLWHEFFPPAEPVLEPLAENTDDEF